MHRGQALYRLESQSAFVRGFIDDVMQEDAILNTEASQSAFVRGFIDDARIARDS